MASSFFISDYWQVSDGVCDEEVTAELSSERGHSITHLSSLVHDEEFQSAARIHACNMLAIKMNQISLAQCLLNG